LVLLHQNFYVIVAGSRHLLIQFGSRHRKVRKFINALILFCPFLDHRPKLFQMLPMRFVALWRRGFNLAVMTSSHPTASLDILLGTIVGTPAAFDHFLQIFLHVFEFSLDFDGVLFGVASLAFFLIANLLERSQRLSD
jgi:hypothetical protein